MHVYALLRSSTAGLTLPEGVLGSLETITHQQLMAVVEPDLQLEDLQQSDALLLQAVLAHDRVIRELFLQATVLPLRFSSFPARADLTIDLDSNQAQYLAILEQLDGQAEFTLKFTPIETAEPQIAPELKGKDYFLAKKQLFQAQQRQKDLQVQEFNFLMQAIAQLYQVVNQPEAQQVHILVHREKQSALQDAVSKLARQVSSWHLSLGDALPPFHFVGNAEQNIAK